MLPFYKFLSLHDIFFDNSLYYQMEHDFCRILWASLRLLLFYICFWSLLINTRLVFISYFVSVPSRKGHRDLEYQCSFVRLFLFLFALLIIRIETCFCRFFVTEATFGVWLCSLLISWCSMYMLRHSFVSKIYKKYQSLLFITLFFHKNQ